MWRMASRSLQKGFVSSRRLVRTFQQNALCLQLFQTDTFKHLFFFASSSNGLTVGMIVRVEKDACAVLIGNPDRQNVRTVTRPQIERKVFERSFSTQNMTGAAITVRDVVKKVHTWEFKVRGLSKPDLLGMGIGGFRSSCVTTCMLV
jgi:hypothetical protein